MREWIWNNSQHLGELGQVVTALVAAIGVGFAWGQIASARRLQAEASAIDVWRGFEIACFENPQFANPDLLAIDLDKKTVDGDPLKFERYYRFVSLFLNAAEQIFDMSNSKDWRNAVEFNLKKHRKFLITSYMADANKFFPRKFVDFMRRSLTK